MTQVESTITAAQAPSNPSPNRSQATRTLVLTGLNHALHDGFTDTLYVLQTPPTCDFQQFGYGTMFPADVLFAGLAPGTIGVEQLDVLVPAQAAAAPARHPRCVTHATVATGCQRRRELRGLPADSRRAR